MSFDVRRQDASRRAGRATSGSSRINDLHLRAARRELVSHGAAHHTRANDGDVHRGILVNSQGANSQRPILALGRGWELGVGN